MATKKDVTTTATATTKADVKSAAKTAPVKTEVTAAPAKAETKAATAKAEVKTDAKKATVAKKTTTKTAAAKKTTTRATAKKTTAKKPTTKAVKENVFVIEYDEVNISQADVMDKVKAALTEQGAKPAGLKNVDVYVQPKNNVAYYVSNAGKASELKGSVALS